jgi:hypothetical protein
MKKQVFIKIIESNRKKFLKRLSSYKDMTLHVIFLKNEYIGWNETFTEKMPSKKYGALLSYTYTI